MLKPLRKLGKEGHNLITVKAMFAISTANVILNGEILRGLSSNSRTRQVCPISPLLFSILLKVLARAIKQAKGIKGYRAHDPVLESLKTKPENSWT